MQCLMLMRVQYQVIAVPECGLGMLRVYGLAVKLDLT